MSSPGNEARALRYIEWLRRRAGLMLLGFFLAAGLAGYLASRLELRAQFSELLPEGDPAVVQLDRLLKRVGASTLFVVMLESDRPEENRAFARDLVARLEKAPAGTWRSISYETSQEKAFLEKYGILYADLEDLEQLRVLMKREIDKRKTGAVGLDEGESLDDLGRRLEAKYKQKFSDRLRFQSGYLESEDQRKLLVMVRPESEALGGEETDRAYELVDTAVQETRAAHGDAAKDLTIVYTGNIPTILQEKAALKEDLGISSAACIILVCLVIALYFRQAGAVLLVATPALLGTLFAFAVARLAIGYLNSNTAFLGSIILGNGINYAVIYLARYREERLRGIDPRGALARGLALTWKPTLAAAVGASTAYGSLMVTQFRGFNQFGLVGFVGMLFCWLLTYSLLPVLVFVGERLRPPKFDTYVHGQVSLRLPGTVLEGLTRLVIRRPGVFLASGAVLLLVALVPVYQLGQDPFEYDFSKLRNQRALTEGPASHLEEVGRIFGRQLSPAILAADDPTHAQEARQRIIQRDEAKLGGRECVGRMELLGDFLPEHQAPKLAVLGQARGLLQDDALSLAGPDERQRLESLRDRLDGFFPEGKASLLTLQTLPKSAVAPYTEKDGSLGKLLQVERGPGVNELNGRDLLCFAAATTELQLSDGELVSATGNPAAVFADMINAIVRDGPRATLAALVAVSLLLIVTFRRVDGFVTVLGGLFLGVSLMLGIAVLLGMRLNFLNFVSIPITFGIASEYGVNIYERGKGVALSELAPAVRGTGGAVALCSLTTIIGYGTLLLSDNQALNSFGKLAGLGEVTTLLAALVVVPAALSLQHRIRAKKAGQNA
jgi:hypothetical protein